MVKIYLFSPVFVSPVGFQAPWRDPPSVVLNRQKKIINKIDIQDKEYYVANNKEPS
jgi:hypothetical protein